MHHSGGYVCTVRVNHRDYSTDAAEVHGTAELAREAAAQRAYMITRNISASDNMYGQGAVPPALLGPGPGAQGGFNGASAQPRYVPDQPLMYAGNGLVQASQAGINAQMGSGVIGGVMVGHSQM